MRRLETKTTTWSTTATWLRSFIWRGKKILIALGPGLHNIEEDDEFDGRNVSQSRVPVGVVSGGANRHGFTVDGVGCRGSHVIAGRSCVVWIKLAIHQVLGDWNLVGRGGIVGNAVQVLSNAQAELKAML